MRPVDFLQLQHLAAVNIALMVAIIFLMAWTAFGRPRHALIWSAAFAIATVAWSLQLLRPDAGSPLTPAILMLHGVAATLIAYGFRIRSGRFPRWRMLVVATLAQMAGTVALAALERSGPVQAVPLTLHATLMFRLAARALVGRREGERGAERIAALALNLLTLAGLAALVLIARTTAGHVVGMATLLAFWSLLLPALVTGIGLFTICLLTADLADGARRLAGLDMLTGLLNRRGFEEAGRALLGSMKRTGRDMTLMLVDIDRFKSVNDRFGHPAGDRLLQDFAERLRGQLQRRDLMARMGGEEFAIVLADTDTETAIAAAEAMRASVADAAFLVSAPLNVTASFGITPLRVDDADLVAPLARADHALYRSKEEGRNRATLLV